MHPIEMLRFVARGDVISQRVLLRDATQALAAFTWDPPGLVLACRRLVAMQPGSAPLVWLAARVLVAVDPEAELDEVRRELADDPTEADLRAAVPRGSSVGVLPGAELVRRALRSREDVVALPLVPDALRSGAGPDALSGRDEVVVLEVRGVGPGEVLAPAGAVALVEAARAAAVPVIAVGGVGSSLPDAMWEPFVEAAVAGGRSSHEALELVPLDLIDTVVTPASTCPVVPELFRTTVL